ncbi:hypothetical protein RUND412_003274 [Rhizina undulata]
MSMNTKASFEPLLGHGDDSDTSSSVHVLCWRLDQNFRREFTTLFDCVGENMRQRSSTFERQNLKRQLSDRVDSFQKSFIATTQKFKEDVKRKIDSEEWVLDLYNNVAQFLKNLSKIMREFFERIWKAIRDMVIWTWRKMKEGLAAIQEIISTYLSKIVSPENDWNVEKNHSD